MNETEKSRYRDMIAQKLAEIDEESGLGQDGQSIVALDQQSVGRLSRMDALQSQAMAKAQQVRRDAKRLALLAALDRLDADDFGWCEDCGDPIALKRLEFDPSVTRCISCAKG